MNQSAVALTHLTTASLAELSSHEPDLWRQVMKNLRGAVEHKKFDQLAEMAQKSQALLARWSAAGGSPLAETQHVKQDLIKARMTVLAVEQFIAAFTGSTIKPTIFDRLLLNFRILPQLEKGNLWDLKQFDQIWSKLKGQGAAASIIQNAGFWSIPTREVTQGIRDYAQGQEILEIGAGRGLYIAALSQVGASVTGVDDCSWEPAKNKIKRCADKIQQKSATESLAELNPKVVLSVWPPPGNTFEREIFATKSVHLYMAIVSKHRFASGNWRDYQAQESAPRGFSCVTNESMNKLLRPIEAEQQILIFRRKSQ